MAARIDFGSMRLGALEHVDRHFEQRMLIADRLRPRPLGRVRYRRRSSCRALWPVRPDLNGKFGVHQISVVRPLPRGPSEATTEREQQRLADGHDLGMEALLRRLRPERREIGRDHVADDDLGAGALERRNLRGEIVVHHLIAAGIDAACSRPWQAPAAGRAADRPRHCRRRRWGTGRRRLCWSARCPTSADTRR